MDSILTSIKKLLGMTEEYTHFDNDIIMHINSALMVLWQLGIGGDKPASIHSNLDTWLNTLGDIDDLEAVRTYVYLKVRLVFDPPSSSFVLESINRQISEYEWRLQVQKEHMDYVDSQTRY